ncbi:unnamed protein product [Linum trigynum]|uniref:Uncharacterized protein n=1 Tax=Linum trigynum TaxID=586398 RepID=A0AAV2CZJ2_9ROSI
MMGGGGPEERGGPDGGVTSPAGVGEWEGPDREASCAGEASCVEEEWAGGSPLVETGVEQLGKREMVGDWSSSQVASCGGSVEVVGRQPRNSFSTKTT